MSEFLVKDLKKLLETIDEDLPVATFDHYADPIPFTEHDFRVSRQSYDPKSKKFFVIENKDIGPEPD